MEVPFYIDDENLIHLISNIDVSSDDLSKIVNLIDIIHTLDKTNVLVSNDTLSHQVGDKKICDYMYSDLMQSQYRDLTLELSTLLDRIDEFNPDDFFNEDFSPETDGGSCAYLALKEYGCGALISSFDAHTYDWWIDDAMSLIDAEDRIREHFRKIINLHFSIESLEELYPEAFDSIYFYENINKIQKTGICLDTNKHIILRHLSYLNDSAQSDYLNHRDKFIGIASGAGVDLSPENQNTHRNTAAMKQRTININGEDIICEWHTKITATQGRIHFHNGSNLPQAVTSITQGKLIISAFIDHFQ